MKGPIRRHLFPTFYANPQTKGKCPVMNDMAVPYLCFLRAAGFCPVLFSKWLLISRNFCDDIHKQYFIKGIVVGIALHAPSSIMIHLAKPI